MKNEELAAIEEVVALEITQIREKLIKDIGGYDTIYSEKSLRALKINELIQVHESMFIDLRRKLDKFF